jgi:hypothetical protein
MLSKRGIVIASLSILGFVAFFLVVPPVLAAVAFVTEILHGW